MRLERQRYLEPGTHHACVQVQPVAGLRKARFGGRSSRDLVLESDVGDSGSDRKAPKECSRSVVF